MHAQSRPREPPDRLNLLPVAFKQVDQAPSSLHGALGRVAHAVGEEREPLLPISRLPHAKANFKQLVREMGAKSDSRAELETALARLTARDYRRAVLYSTLSPCDMCSGTALLYRIPRIVIGENRTFRGPEDYVRSRGVELEVVQHPDCIRLMEEFIRTRPGEVIGNPACVGLVFGAHAVLARAYRPAERFETEQVR